MAANNKVKLDVTLPLTDVGGASETVQRFAQEAEAWQGPWLRKGLKGVPGGPGGRTARAHAQPGVPRGPTSPRQSP